MRQLTRIVGLLLLLLPGNRAQSAQPSGGDGNTSGTASSPAATVPSFSPAAPIAPEVMTRDAEGRITARATRLVEPLVVDGKLDDPVYSEVESMTGFIQQVPNEGDPATEKNEAWIFFDDENLYVAVRCWDSHPERMVVNEMRRDHFNIRQNENFSLVFDTDYDRRNGVNFTTNPLAANFVRFRSSPMFSWVAVPIEWIRSRGSCRCSSASMS